MCRMLGIAGACSKEILLNFSKLAVKGNILPSKKQGHADGWGITAYFKNENNPFYKRLPISINEKLSCYSEIVEKITKQAPKMLIAHMRKASCGNITLDNTHPFLYDSWAFCHNGDIFEHTKLKLINELHHGHTDSERFFRFVIEKIKEKNIKPDNIRQTTQSIINSIHYVKENFDYESLTFLLSNKNYIFAYRDVNEKSKKTTFNFQELEKYYTLYWAQLNNSLVICSEPQKLNNISWEILKNNEFMAIDNAGSICVKKIL